eukprot:TRINITY_DN6080_c0_g1_i4.p1 TRINITY_DN6080_c0_g1~~TRINITY_DN6080_c0_g1_i4.p1  ORF type:complete len:133 (+),score=29.94 TRINITY_DN6080_c0_g1_i4:308-706(+)
MVVIVLLLLACFNMAPYGGDSSSVASSLQSGVVQVFGFAGFGSSGGAFAAIKDDGSVVTWGNENYGGDSSSVADSLQSGVVQVFGVAGAGGPSGGGAFAAIKDDGSVVTWGNENYGGDSSYVVTWGHCCELA